MTTPSDNPVRLPKYVCAKHGELPFAFRVDHRAFCPKCVADHMEKHIGLAWVK